MKLTYQTGIATLIQLAVMTALNIANAAYSSVQQCTDGGNNCVSNLILSLLFFIVITVWFAILWILGAAAQDRRSRKLALILLGAEVLVALIALSDAKRHTYLLGLITSLSDAVLAIWVAFLTIRLVRARGGRVSTSGRARQRRLKKEL